MFEPIKKLKRNRVSDLDPKVRNFQTSFSNNSIGKSKNPTSQKLDSGTEETFSLLITETQKEDDESFENITKDDILVRKSAPEESPRFKPRSVNELLDYLKQSESSIALPPVSVPTTEGLTAADYFERFISQTNSIEPKKGSPDTLSFTMQKGKIVTVKVEVRQSFSSEMAAEYKLYTDEEQFVSFDLEVE